MQAYSNLKEGGYLRRRVEEVMDLMKKNKNLGEKLEKIHWAKK
jgi:hypothetical protein